MRTQTSGFFLNIHRASIFLTVLAKLINETSFSLSNSVEIFNEANSAYRAISTAFRNKTSIAVNISVFTRLIEHVDNLLEKIGKHIEDNTIIEKSSELQRLLTATLSDEKLIVTEHLQTKKEEISNATATFVLCSPLIQEKLSRVLTIICSLKMWLSHFCQKIRPEIRLYSPFSNLLTLEVVLINQKSSYLTAYLTLANYPLQQVFIQMYRRCVSSNEGLTLQKYLTRECKRLYKAIEICESTPLRLYSYHQRALAQFLALGQGLPGMQIGPQLVLENEQFLAQLPMEWAWAREPLPALLQQRVQIAAGILCSLTDILTNISLAGSSAQLLKLATHYLFSFQTFLVHSIKTIGGDEITLAEKKPMIDWVLGLLTQLSISGLFTGLSSFFPVVFGYTLATTVSTLTSRAIEKLAQRYALPESRKRAIEFFTQTLSYGISYYAGSFCGISLNQYIQSRRTEAAALEILGFKARPDSQTMTSQFRFLALQNHPDKCSTPQCKINMININWANAYLKNNLN